MKAALPLVLLLIGTAHAADPALPYRASLMREAQAVYGVGAAIPLFAGQIRQESNWNPQATAWDGGRGLAQFMDSTAATIAARYPELGAADPYDPRWAIRALVRYDGWLYDRVRGVPTCQRWAATLKGYNAGLGYVQRAQARSPHPNQWFGVTEWLNVGQSAQNFRTSRAYPRQILFTHQLRYLSWGERTCGASP